MCGGGGSPPPVVQRDPKAEAEQAANQAAQKANAEAASRKLRRKQSSLLATGSEGLTGPASVLGSARAQAKPTLGA